MKRSALPEHGLPQLPALPRLEGVPNEMHDSMLLLARIAYLVADRNDICPLCLVDYLVAVFDKAVDAGILEHANAGETLN